MIRGLLLVMFSAFVVGCTSLSITPKENQEVIYNRGNGVVLCKSERTAIAVEGIGPAPMGAGRTAFAITFVNKGARSIDFGLENVTATNEKGKRVRLYTAEELEREARTAAAVQAIAIGMNAASQSFAAAQPAMTSYSGNYYGTSNYGLYNRNYQPVGYATGTHAGSLYGTSTTYNPAQQAIANQAIQANARASIADINSTLATNLGSASAVLARTTVPPGGSLTALLIARKAAVTTFVVSVAGETHTASFNVR